MEIAAQQKNVTVMSVSHYAGTVSAVQARIAPAAQLIAVVLVGISVMQVPVLNVLSMVIVVKAINVLPIVVVVAMRQVRPSAQLAPVQHLIGMGVPAQSVSTIATVAAAIFVMQVIVFHRHLHVVMATSMAAKRVMIATQTVEMVVMVVVV